MVLMASVKSHLRLQLKPTAAQRLADFLSYSIVIPWRSPL